MATARVQSAATKTADIHGSREPARDDGAAAENCDQDGSVQKKILQLVSLRGEPLNSEQSSSATTPDSPSICFDEPARVHTLL